MATKKRTKRRGPKRRASNKSMKRMSRKTAKRSGKKNSGKKKSGKKRSGKKNAFFSLMLKAKKSGAPSFVYNGDTYWQKKKGPLIFYAKK